MYYSLVEVLKNGTIAQRNGFIIYEVVSSTTQHSTDCPKVGTRLTLPELAEMYPGVSYFIEQDRYADLQSGEIFTV